MSHETSSDPVERTSLAAAGAINAVGSLLDQLVEASGKPRQDIAAAMGVTPARISQILSGDGNVRIATLARLAEACDAELSITATLRSTGDSVTVPRPVGRRRSPSPGTPSTVASTATPFDDVERTSLAAAALINAVGSLMEQTVELSGLAQRDVAAAMGVTPGRVSQIVDGDGNVRIATLARVVAAVDAQLTMTATARTDGSVITVPREATRRRSVTAPTAEDIDLASHRRFGTPAPSGRQAATRIRQLVPLTDLVSRGILPTDAAGQAEAVCELLEISSLDEDPTFAAAARRHNPAEPATLHQRAWLACARRAARSRRARDLDRDGLRELAAGLSHDLVDPERFADLAARYAAVGVRLVYVEQFRGGKISGVAFRLNPHDRTASIALSGRGKRLDKVLFTLLHESAHVVLGHARSDNVTLDVDVVDAAGHEEAEANAVAASWALPEPFETPAVVTAEWIEEEAARQSVHPILLVGRLQSEGTVPWGSPLSKAAPTVVSDHLKCWSYAAGEAFG